MEKPDTSTSFRLKDSTQWNKFRIKANQLTKYKGCNSAIHPFPSRASNAPPPAQDGAAEPAEEPPAPATRAQRDQAYGIIISLIDDSLYTAFNPFEEDPKKIIQQLYDFFFLNTASNLTALADEFQELSMQPSETATQFAGRITLHVEKMDAQGGKPNEPLIKARFRAGLQPPDRWLPFKQQIDAKEATGTVVTYEQLCIQAAMYETTLRSADGGTAMYASKPSKPKCGRCGKLGHTSDDCWDTDCIKRLRDRNSNITCDRCLEQGHKAADCPAPAPAQRNKRDKECYKCGERGHIRRDCPEEEPAAKTYFSY